MKTIEQIIAEPIVIDGDTLPALNSIVETFFQGLLDNKAAGKLTAQGYLAEFADKVRAASGGQKAEAERPHAEPRGDRRDPMEGIRAVTEMLSRATGGKTSDPAALGGVIGTLIGDFLKDAGRPRD